MKLKIYKKQKSLINLFYNYKIKIKIMNKNFNKSKKKKLTIKTL